MNPILNVLLSVTSSLVCLAGDAAAQRLLALDTSGNVHGVDRSTGTKQLFAVLPAGLGTTNGLAVHAPSGIAYVSSTTTDALYALDLVTGVTALVGPFGDPAVAMQSLELVGDQLYGASAHNGGLYLIDRTTGATALTGLLGFVGTPNLIYDSRDDRLFATSTAADSLFLVDRTTGVATLIGNLQGSTNPQGLAFDSDSGALWLVDNASDLLYTIDPATGRGHAVGSTGAGNLVGLAYVPGGIGAIHRLSHQCGGASIVAGGDPRIGGVVHVFLDETTGVPFVGFGVQPGALPFCGCTIGHEWAAAFAGASTNLVIPAAPTLIGSQVGMQGLDLFGVGGCVDPAIVLTDTLVLTIG